MKWSGDHAREQFQRLFGPQGFGKKRAGIIIRNRRRDERLGRKTSGTSMKYTKTFNEQIRKLIKEGRKGER